MKPQFWQLSSDAHAGLEREPLRQAGGVAPREEVGVEDADERRGLTAQRRRTARRDDHLVHRDAALNDLEVLFEALAAAHRDRHLLRRIAQGADLDRQAALGQVLEKIVARSVGRRAEGRALYGDRGIGDVFVRVAVDDMAEEVGIGIFPGGGLGARRTRTEAHGKECQQDMRFHKVEICR